MKKHLTFIICFLIAVSVLAQERYPVPARTGDQKHGRTLSQFYWAQAAGINFAKTQGITPYEYGKFIGNLAAPTWGPGNDFEGFVKGIIYNLENFRHVSDATLMIKENEDGSVCITASDKMMHKYFPDGNTFASYDEYKECMKGTFEPIGNHMGASVTLETRDTLLVITLRKK